MENTESDHLNNDSNVTILNSRPIFCFSRNCSQLIVSIINLSSTSAHVRLIYYKVIIQCTFLKQFFDNSYSFQNVKIVGLKAGLLKTTSQNKSLDQESNCATVSSACFSQSPCSQFVQNEFLLEVTCLQTKLFIINFPNSKIVYGTVVFLKRSIGFTPKQFFSLVRQNRTTTLNVRQQ